MVNYQLYRTNVLLGGQMKYDLLLDSNSDETYIKSLHITPISNSVPYNKYVDEEDLINYHHHENIKNYYKEISSSFYSDYLNPVLKTNYPLPEHYKGENKDTTYEMGCRRMNYQLYNKQFEFLCPLWIEQLEDITKLEFEVQISTSPTRIIPMYTRTIKFRAQNDKEKNLITYFNDYLQYTKLNTGCDWVFNISDNEDNCVVHGINVTTGLNTDAKLLKLYSDLTFRERPLLEFNNIIINKLRDNKMIAKQLFNFNFCFNIEDLLNPFLYNKLRKEQLYINIVAKINGKSLEIRDIFSNHEFIEKNKVGIPSISYTKTKDVDTDEYIYTIKTHKDGTGVNVLNYLNDNKHIDLIDKNKMIQTTCHWCRCNNPESHFNFYDGFSLLYIKPDDQQLTLTIPYYNGETANLNIDDIDKTTIGYPYWCNNYKIEGITDDVKIDEFITTFFKPIFNNEGTNDFIFSHFSEDCWVKNINYICKGIKPIDVVILQHDITEAFKKRLTTIMVDYKAWGYKEITLSTENQDQLLIIYTFDNNSNRKVIFIHNITDENANLQLQKIMLYKNFLTLLSSIQVNNFNPLVINDLYQLLSKPNLSQQKVIIFQNSVLPYKTKGPSISIEEIEYYKTTTKKYILREIGKIKPFFIKQDDIYKNYQYSKISINDTDETYKLYINTVWEPKYPSIGYTSLNIRKNIEYGYNEIDDNQLEYHNYTSNKIVELIPEINFEYILKDYTSDSIEKNIYNEIKNLYMTVLGDDETYHQERLNHIVNLYKLTHTYIDTEVNNDEIQYIYKIQIKLK